MAKLKFGTDGVRAVANRDLTPEYAMALGACRRLRGGFWLRARRRRSASFVADARCGRRCGYRICRR
jgi:hypothetical protein